MSGGTGTVRFLTGGDELLAEFDSTGNWLRRYVHGSDGTADDPVLWYEGGAFAGSSERVLRANWQGSVALVTDTAGATVYARNSYDEYGYPGSANQGRFQYTGQAWIAETGLYYYKARMYSPILGRFLQTDPIGYDDQINLYGYVGNDPVNKTDPFGLMSAEDCQKYGGNCSVWEAGADVQSSMRQGRLANPTNDLNKGCYPTAYGCGSSLTKADLDAASAFLKDDVAKAKMKIAWVNSQKEQYAFGLKISGKNEYGFWSVYENGKIKTGNLIKGIGNEISPSGRPSGGVAIFFHVHPFFPSEGGNPYFSNQDHVALRQQNAIGIILFSTGRIDKGLGVLVTGRDK